MGRWSHGARTEAGSLKRIAVSWLKQQGYLQGWRSGVITWTHGYAGERSSIGIAVANVDRDGSVRLYYSQTMPDGGQQEFDYQIPLTTTPCPYGGRRYWFTCPFTRNGNYCGRRVGVLYNNGDYFTCRHCNNLTYNSKNVNRRYKLFYLFHTLELRKKAEELQGRIKRTFYAGQLTRKQQRLQQLRIQSAMNYRQYIRLERQIMLSLNR